MAAGRTGGKLRIEYWKFSKLLDNSSWNRLLDEFTYWRKGDSCTKRASVWRGPSEIANHSRVTDHAQRKLEYATPSCCTGTLAHGHGEGGIRISDNLLAVRAYPGSIQNRQSSRRIWLPEERAANCEFEYWQINSSWNRLLDEFTNGFFYEEG